MATNLFWAGLTIPPAGSINATASSPRAVAAAGSRAVVPLIYGECRVPALLLNVLISAADANVLLVQCLWGHACHQVDEPRLNDLALPAGSSATHYTGAQVSADATLVAAFAAQGITYTDTLAGYAYSVVAMPVKAFDGQLNLSARVRGRKLYDPRKDSTNGGAGLHRLATPSTWEYSDNPALADADFLYSTLYGAGQPVDWASAIITANACDAMIGSPAEKRRIVGVRFAAAASVQQVADTLRAYAGCWHVPTAAGIKLLPDADGAAVATYAHASGQIAGIGALQMPDLGNVPTAVEVVYTDASSIPWREASVTEQTAGAGTTLPWRLSTVRLPGIQRGTQARREAIERLNKLSLGGGTTQAEVFDIGIRHEVGDIVAVTHPLGLANAPMRVLACEMAGPGRWLLQLAQHRAAAYSDSVVAVPSPGSPLLVSPPGPPADVTGLSATVGQGIISWAWNLPADADYAETELRSGGTDWDSAAALWRGRASGLLQRVTATGTYTVRARHVSLWGTLSAGTASNSITVAAGDLVQSEPGSPGLSQTQVWLYQWGSVQPGNPSGTTSWNWSTLAHTAYTGGNGWSVSVPANPGTAGLKLWVAAKGISAPAGTTSTSVSWSGGYSVYAAGSNGGQGPAGIKAATPTVFKWQATLPSAPVGTSTYTWAAADIGPVPSGWTLQPGAGSAGQTLWGAQVQIVDAAGAATSSIDWTLSSITARGYAGINGAAGGAGVGARRAYVLTTAASLGSGSVTSTGSTSLPAAGSYGATGWTSTPSTPAVGQVLYQSDGLYDPATNIVTWSTPYISALKVGNLAALAVNTGALTVQDVLTISSTGNIRGGQTGYDAGTGFFLGYSGGAYKFSLGGSVQSLTWDGAALSIRGALLGGSASAYGSGLGLFSGWAGGVADANYRWRVGNPSGARIQWTGSAVEVYDASGALTLRSGADVYLAGAGINLIYNSAFEAGLEGWSFGSNVITPTLGSGTNLNATWTLAPAGSPWTSVFYAGQGARNGTPNAYFEWSSKSIPVLAGQRYMLSAYIQAHRATVVVFEYFFDATGSVVGTPGLMWLEKLSNPQADAQSLATFDRLYAGAVAPAGAAYSRILMRKYDTNSGSSDSYMFVTRLQFEEVAANVDAPSAWADSSRQHQIVAGNASTYIANAAIGAALVGTLTATNIGALSVHATKIAATQDNSNSSANVSGSIWTFPAAGNGTALETVLTFTPRGGWIVIEADVLVEVFIAGTTCTSVEVDVDLMISGGSASGVTRCAQTVTPRVDVFGTTGRIVSFVVPLRHGYRPAAGVSRTVQYKTTVVAYNGTAVMAPSTTGTSYATTFHTASVTENFV